MIKRDDELWKAARVAASRKGPVNHGTILQQYRALQAKQLTKAYNEVVGELRSSMYERLEVLQKSREVTELDKLAEELEDLAK